MGREKGVTPVSHVSASVRHVRKVHSEGALGAKAFGVLQMVVTYGEPDRGQKDTKRPSTWRGAS